MTKLNSFIFLMSLLLYLFSTTAIGQNNFTLPDGVVKDKMTFKLVNNLVVVPVEVNGVKLSFLLDTGVGSTILFGASKDTLQLRNTRQIKIKGLGANEDNIAIRSDGNIFKIGKAIDENHTIIVILDEKLNLSTRMGVPLHGILGYDFFKNFIIKTDYISEKIVFYLPESYKKRRCKRCETFDLEFYRNKPYISSLTINDENEEKLLLVDSGSSDAMWLFDEKGIIDEESSNYYEDYLGIGLSGNIFGRRTKVGSINFGDFSLNSVNVAIPDKASIANRSFVEGRDGSIGANILKRFTVVMDYPNKKMILKKNRKYKEPFYYNMSGLTIEHDGVTVVKEKMIKSRSDSYGNTDHGNSGSLITVSDTYRFLLTPSYVVVDVREGSPAYKVDIRKGDEIMKVNGELAYNHKLYELIELFSSKKDRTIILEIKRNDVVFKKKFKLRELLRSI